MGGLALRAEFLFLSFSKEKGTKKKGNLRAAPLKIPLIVQNCYAQSKTLCFPFSQLQFALSRDEIVRSGKNKKNLQRYNAERTRAFPSIHCDLRSSGEGGARSRDGCNTLLREVWQHFICDEMLPCAREAGEPQWQLSVRQNFVRRGERYARGYVSKFCLCAFAHAFGMGAPHPALRATFPSRGRLCYASKSHVNITWVGQIFADIARVM